MFFRRVAETTIAMDTGKHVTIIRPPVISSLHSFSSPSTAPIALAYLASSVMHAGYRCAVIDGLGEAIEQVLIYEDPQCKVRGLTIEEIIERIPSDTDMIAISCMFSQEWLFIRRIIFEISEVFPNVPIIIGGEHATALPEEILKTCPPIVLCAQGEGEETMVDILNRYPEEVSDIEGIVFRNNEGKIIRNPRRPRIRNLEAVPRPAWHLLPIEAYLSKGHSVGVNTGRAMPLLATRGCPFQCTFCSNKAMWTQKYYTRCPEDVIDEIEGYVRDYNIDSVEFFDLTAIVKKDWIMKFGALLKERGLNIGWSLPSGTRSEALDADVTKLLAETNCKYLVYAAESGSPRMLKYIRKEIKLDKMLASMRSAKKNNLNLRCNLMLGFPTEKRMDVLRTIFFQVRLALAGVDDAPLYMFSPYPGTYLYEKLKADGRVKPTNDEYFRSLLCQMDLTENSSYCENIPPWELGIYRVVGMSLFYSLSYISRPYRIYRSIRNIFFTKRTSTVFEQRIIDMLETKKHIALNKEIKVHKKRTTVAEVDNIEITYGSIFTDENLPELEVLFDKKGADSVRVGVQSESDEKQVKTPE